MAVYAIGDIQGCFDEFIELLKQIKFDRTRDQLWLVGDLVNRGPKSLQVLRYVRSLGDAAITVLGNHDLHLLAVATIGERIKSKDTLDEILNAPDREELMLWLRHRPLLHHDATLGFTMIHAGLAPQWDLTAAQACAREVESALRDPSSLREFFYGLYGDTPTQWADDLLGIERLRFIVNCLTRMRLCDRAGRLALQYKSTLDQAPAGLVPWFRAPQRRSRDLRIVCGHWSALGFYNDDGVISLDTGCVWGAQLCAVQLDAPYISPVFVQCRRLEAEG